MNSIPWLTVWFMVGFVAFQVYGNLCLVMANARTGLGAMAFFAISNILGFFATVLLTLSLRGQNPNVIYPLSQGLVFCVLQLALFVVFGFSMSTVQWLGAVLVCGGVVCLTVVG